MFSNHLTTRTIPILVVIPSIQGQDILAQATAKDHVWVMVQLQLGSVLMSVASVTSGGLRNHVR